MIIGGASHARVHAHAHAHSASAKTRRCSRSWANNSALQPELPAQVNLQRITQHGSRDAAEGGEASLGPAGAASTGSAFFVLMRWTLLQLTPQENRTVSRHARAWGSAGDATASADAGSAASRREDEAFR